MMHVTMSVNVECKLLLIIENVGRNLKTITLVNAAIKVLVSKKCRDVVCRILIGSILFEQSTIVGSKA